MRARKKGGFAAAFAAALALSLAVGASGGGAAKLALAAGSLLGGPAQALRAAASLCAEPAQSADTNTAADAAAGIENDIGDEMAPDTGGLWPAAGAATSVPVDSAANSVALLDDSARPENAGTVTEKNYGQGSGGIYTACGGGSIRNNTKKGNDEVAAAISEGLPFDIEKNSSEPQVLILHTHATETYRLSAGLWFDPADTARSTDDAVNMCAVGAVMADVLNAVGVNTLHDTTLNDYPSYTGSYANSRAVAQNYLAQYPSIKVVLDVHRDAIETGGVRIAPVCNIAGRQAAQVMLICGCDNGTTVPIPNYHENLRFAAAWESQMEALYPGFTRPVLFSYRYYNQDLSTGALLIEVGGHGNNLSEALYAGQLAGQALAALFGA